MAAKIPNLKLQVLVGDLFNITANGGLSDDNFVKSKLVKNGGLASVVHPHNNDLKLDVVAPESTQPTPQL